MPKGSWVCKKRKSAAGFSDSPSQREIYKIFMEKVKISLAFLGDIGYYKEALALRGFEC
jgi:hypothetical protein